MDEVKRFIGLFFFVHEVEKHGNDDKLDLKSRIKLYEEEYTNFYFTPNLITNNSNNSNNLLKQCINLYYEDRNKSLFNN